MSEHRETAERLHPIEMQTLACFRERNDLTHDELLTQSMLKESQLRTALEWLLHKELITSREEGKEESVTLTRIGEDFASNGIPEGRIVRTLMEKGDIPLTLPDIASLTGLEQSQISPAIGELKKREAISFGEGGRLIFKEGPDLSFIDFREGLLRKLQERSPVLIQELSDREQDEVRSGWRKRSPEKGIYRIDERPLLCYSLNETGVEVLPYVHTKPMVNQLTPQMLKSGDWKHCEFRKYDITLKSPRIQIGKKHPYRQYLDRVRAKLVSLGFMEMTGPLVETEFWDMDALFMPQFHSARNIHDVYFIKEPHHAEKIEEPFLSSVAAAHEHGGGTGSSGWGYKFDAEKTLRLVLRSQGTALSARTLAGGPVIPGKYFAIARCFRYDQIDATHGTDFFQVEGIVVDPSINFRKLLGLLTLFADEIAKAEKTKFAPAYFPFTEPSVELHACHPKLGWMELGGAGLFRPEVTRPLGVTVPVIAWGLGIDRMAMLSLGINDIRELFTHDLEFLRQSKVVL